MQQLELTPRDYTKGLTDQERELLDAIRRAGQELMAILPENHVGRASQNWRRGAVSGGQNQAFSKSNMMQANENER